MSDFNNITAANFKYCSYCGKVLLPDWSFCPFCGKHIPASCYESIIANTMPEFPVESASKPQSVSVTDKEDAYIDFTDYFVSSIPELEERYETSYEGDSLGSITKEYEINPAKNSYKKVVRYKDVYNSHGTDCSSWVDIREVDALTAAKAIKDKFPEDSKVLEEFHNELVTVLDNCRALLDSKLSDYSYVSAEYLSEHTTVFRITDAEGTEKICKLYLIGKERYSNTVAFYDWCRSQGRDKHLLLPEKIIVIGETEDGRVLEADVFPVAKHFERHSPYFPTYKLWEHVGREFNDHEQCRFAIDVTEGLCALHDFGLAHLDIKPENCYAASDGRYMLGDFDSMRPLDCNNVQELHFTRSYAAPELIKLHLFDERSDIYSLGKVFAALTTKNSPLNHVAAKATADIPGDRYADAHALYEELKSLSLTAEHLKT